MKTKMLLLSSAVVLMAAIYSSCSKDQEKIESIQIDVTQQLKFVPLADRIKEEVGAVNREQVIILTWKEWGREKKDCEGFGLCKAKWFPERNRAVLDPVGENGCASILEFDERNSKYYFDIVLADYPPPSIPDSALSLIVDYDIVLDLNGEIGKDLIIKRGDYNYDRTLNVYGGYRIYLGEN